jgi:thymidylate kinase
MFDTMDEVFQNPYVVMNKYDEVPSKLPSDLDICITPLDFKRLDVIIPQVAKSIDLLVVQKVWHGYEKCAYVLAPLLPKRYVRLQLDFFTDFSVKHTPQLISFSEIQSETRTYGRFTVPSYQMEYVFLLMRRIFKNDFDEEHMQAIYRAFRGNEKGCETYIKNYFSQAISDKINIMIKQNDVSGLKLLRPALWKELQILSEKNSKGLFRLKFYLNEFRRYLFRIKNPVGLCVAILSSDGGGKSSIIEELKETCWGTFYGVNRLYFRPHLFCNPGMLNPVNPVPESAVNPNPHGIKPNGIIKSVCRYFYYNMDFILGYYLLVKRMCVQKKLVLFDRYYYDYFVDMYRYHYSLPKWFPKLFAWSIPTPDLIFILEGTASVLYERKRELPLEEIERQVNCYREIAKSYKKVELINVDEPLETVVNNVTRKIIIAKAKMTARSMHFSVNENGIPIE